MPSIMTYCLASALLVGATPAFADPFDGTWKGDIASATVSGKPDTFRIKNGLYSCSSCTPSYSVMADGAFHSVKGKPYWDETSIAVVDDHTVTHQYKKTGKVIATSTETVSADGKTLTTKSMNTNNAAGVPVEVTDPGKTMTKAERLGPRSIRLTDMRDGKVVGVSTYTIAADGTTMIGKWTDPSTGQSGNFMAYKQ